ncbi:MAG: IS630 family transposase [Proteobacteria bacterium]|nr:IS630 family transposase [Pseudomonadota bacterium]
MERIVIRLGRSRNRRLSRKARQVEDPKLAKRYLIVVNLDEGRTVADTARALGVSETTVRRVRSRFLDCGEAGLVDRREENGDRKLDEQYLAILHEVVASSPQKHGFPRPTWTREMLVEVLKRKTGVEVDVSTMSRALAQIGARRGRPKPTVECPWSKAAKTSRLRQIEQLLDTLPADEVAVYEDEVDIHLNPKIGLDWMVEGQQKEVMTPGQNHKRYLAGAQDVTTGELFWVEGEKKDSLLFICLLWKLTQHYRKAKKIHVILDNYSIHSTQQVELSLETPEGQRIQLHFLPPYCPDHNKIERAWQDLHANVTRNHTCTNIDELMSEVRRYLRRHNERQLQEYAIAA